jgi:hypothetical protein
MAVTLKRLLLVEGRRPAGWDRRDEEQQPEIAAGIAAISSCSSSCLMQQCNLAQPCLALFHQLCFLGFSSVSLSAGIEEI